MASPDLWLTVAPVRNDPDDDVWLVTVLERFVQQRLDWACSTVQVGRDPEVAFNDLLSTQVALLLVEPEMLGVWDQGLALVGPDDRRRLLHLYDLYIEQWAQALSAVQPDLDYDAAWTTACELVAMIDARR